MPPEEEVVERVDALPSEDNGNVAIDDIKPTAPSVEAEPATPAEKVDPVTLAEPEVELFELPDGRKVDAATLSREFKENFIPEFTRKSQELAELKKGIITNDNKPTPKPYEDPEWQPQTYAELIAIAKEEVKGDLEAREKAAIEQRQSIENAVVAQLEEVKKIDPTVNENALFLHANKYGFRDLKLAHQNMKDMSDVIKKTQKVTADNITKRNDPVSIKPGAGGEKPNPSNFGNAVDFLRSLK